MTSEARSGETADESGAPLTEIPPAAPPQPEPKGQKGHKRSTGDQDSTQKPELPG